jgi:hypothetical protein
VRADEEVHSSELNANALTRGLSALLGAALLALVRRRRRGVDPELAALTRLDGATWCMPPLAELTPPAWSAARKVGMLTLRRYLFIAARLVVVKVIELAVGH